MQKISLLKNENGGALPLVIIVVLLLAILSSSVVYLTSSNIRQAKYQELSMQAYYLARSGAELGYEVLLMDDGELLNGFTDQLGPEEVQFDEGSVHITITTFTKNGQPWVNIESIARLNKGNVERTVQLEVNKDNPENFRWIN